MAEEVTAETAAIHAERLAVSVEHAARGPEQAAFAEAARVVEERRGAAHLVFRVLAARRHTARLRRLANGLLARRGLAQACTTGAASVEPFERAKMDNEAGNSSRETMSAATAARSHANSTSPLTVAIVGAGFGGIAAAIELKRHGIDDVTILERAPQLGRAVPDVEP